MEIGMLWYDDDTKRPLGEKVARAVEYYKSKYGNMPTVCFVNPATLQNAPETAAGVQIRSARNVMVDHFWLGIGETTNGNGARSNGKATAARAGSSRAGRASRAGATASPAGRAG